MFSTATPSPAPIERVRDAFRPLILRLPQKAMRERALQRHLQRMEIAVAVVPASGRTPANCGNGRLPVAGSIRFVVRESEQLVSFAALVTDREHETARQLLLDIEVPVLVVQIAAKPIDRPLGLTPSALQLAEERLDRVGQVLHDGRGKRVVAARCDSCGALKSSFWLAP